MIEAAQEMYGQGFDDGYKHAVERLKREGGLTSRLAPPEYFWNEVFKFDLREATRGEQEAVRVLFLAQRLPLDEFSITHCAIVELVLGHKSEARKHPAARFFSVGRLIDEHGIHITE